MADVVLRSLTKKFGNHTVVDHLNLAIKDGEFVTLLGPSGCGKTTLLRMIAGFEEPDDGAIHLHGSPLWTDGRGLSAEDRKIGMVFQRPNPFPQSIYNNVAFGPRIMGLARGKNLDDIVAESLQEAALWDEVENILQNPAQELNPGQQQRLCIARAIAVKPEVILMDEPCSALDPVATLAVEGLMRRLSKNYTIIIVTHSMQQAARASDWTGFFWLGRLIEFNLTETLFTDPDAELTESYITGRQG